MRARFVDEDQTLGRESGLLLSEGPTRLHDVGAITLGSVGAFF